MLEVKVEILWVSQKHEYLVLNCFPEFVCWIFFIFFLFLFMKGSIDCSEATIVLVQKIVHKFYIESCYLVGLLRHFQKGMELAGMI